MSEQEKWQRYETAKRDQVQGMTAEEYEQAIKQLAEALEL